jgi:hypothetical protein
MSSLTVIYRICAAQGILMHYLYLRDRHRGPGQPVFLKAQNAVRINNVNGYERQYHSKWKLT